MIAFASFSMELPTRFSPRRQSPAEEAAEEIASRILACAEFVEWTTPGSDNSVWRLFKPVAGHAPGELLTRGELVRIFEARRTGR